MKLLLGRFCFTFIIFVPTRYAAFVYFAKRLNHNF